MGMARITSPPSDAANYARSQTYGTRERTKADLKLYPNLKIGTGPTIAQNGKIGRPAPIRQTYLKRCAGQGYPGKHPTHPTATFADALSGQVLSENGTDSA